MGGTENVWTCRLHNEDWPEWSPIGLCGCLRPETPRAAQDKPKRRKRSGGSR